MHLMIAHKTYTTCDSNYFMHQYCLIIHKSGLVILIYIMCTHQDKLSIKNYYNYASNYFAYSNSRKLGEVSHKAKQFLALSVKDNLAIALSMISSTVTSLALHSNLNSNGSEFSFA